MIIRHGLKCILTLLICGYSLLLGAQSNVGSPALISANNAVLYVDIKNEVTLNQTESTDISLVSKSAYVLPAGDGKWILQYRFPGTDTVKVMQKTASGEKLLATQTFLIQPLPQPVVRLAGNSSERFSKAEILARPVIEVVQFLGSTEINYEILNYKFLVPIVRDSTGGMKLLYGTGNLLTQEVRSAIMYAHLHDEFYLLDVCYRFGEKRYETRKANMTTIRIMQ